MKNYKMLVEYDGSRFRGWQRLKNADNTIQQKIEDVLSKMLDNKVNIIGSGRTDAGVHALNQVANFHCDTKMSCNEIQDYCNHYLPNDIVIKKIDNCDERFHSRYNVKSKKYIYRIVNGNIPPVFDRKYVYYIKEKLDIDLMIKASKYFIGEKDFKAFTSMKSKKKTSVRNMYSININVNKDKIDIEYHGDGFLHKMLRIITGTLIEIGLGKMPLESINSIFDNRVRADAGITAPAQGLCLLEAIYKK